MTVTTANRRREVGFASARSLLLTVLGEFVHPRARPVWTSTLLEAMAALGVEEKSARQALARTASEGVLTSNRDGRRVHWSLTAHGETLLRGGPSASTASCAARTRGTGGGWCSPCRCPRPSGRCATSCARA